MTTLGGIFFVLHHSFNEFESGNNGESDEKNMSRVAKFGSPSIWAWYQREMASYLQTVLDLKLCDFLKSNHFLLV